MKKQQMKLESLSGSKFEVLSNETMRFIVGGGTCDTGSGSSKAGACYSNDYMDGGHNNIKAGGGDFTPNELQQLSSQANCATVA